ncbi:MAG: HAD hydrolase-like protein [archaeon]
MNKVSPSNNLTKSPHNSKKLIILDYDGVIVDSFPTQYEVYKVICQKLGKKIQPTIEEYSKAFSVGYIPYRASVGITTPYEFKIADKLYEEEVLKHKPPLFGGIKEVLLELEKKYLIVLVSANFKINVIDKLLHYQIHHHFSHLIGLEANNTEPMDKAVEIKKLLLELDIRAKDAVMIGDRNNDYFEAKGAGLDKIILTNYGWGFDREKTFDRVKVEVNKPSDILVALKSINF